MTQPDAPPHRRLFDLLTAYWHGQAVHVAAKLNLADRLQAGPRTPADLAAEAGVQAGPLYRLLRALASLGIFAEDGQGRFGLTPPAEALLDRPGSMYAVALMMGGEHYRAWGDLLYSVRTGRPAFDHVYGKPVFEYLSERPDDAKVFDAAMTGIHGPETQAMLDAYDFAGIGTLVDVGGGNGSVLCTVLQKYPAMRGLLYDLPGVVARSTAHIAAAGLADRCRAAGGSFFEAVPPGGDAYLMRHILHDWTDEQCATILGHCHKAMPAGGRLLVIEMVVEPGNAPGPAKFLDLNMLVIPGGRERTAAEYRDLFARSGFRLDRVVPTPGAVSVLEARKAEQPAG